MDELCTKFTKAASLLHNYYDPTPFQLYIGEYGGVFSSQQILKYILIGELHGVPEYAHVIEHDEYITIRDGLVLDLSVIPSPRSILTCMRSEWEADKAGNCMIRMEVNEETHESRFYVWTTERVDEKEELIYFT